MLNQGTVVSDFEVFRQMQTTLHQEETELAESKLISDGTFPTRLESYELIAADRLPHAGVVGYRLCTNVEADGTVKKHWLDVYFTPVNNAKGLVPQSRLGIQLAQVIGMNEGDTFVDVLERAKFTSVDMRITKSAAKNGYKAKNWTQKITTHKEVV